MKQRPILFSTPMVQSVLKGIKTQTRRLKALDEINNKPDDYLFNGFGNNSEGVFGALFMHKQGLLHHIPCPFGVVGDVLWVRESFTNVDYPPFFEHRALHCGDRLIKWKPSIHMPKQACRIWLRITDVKVERLQSISEEDARREGVDYVFDRITGYCGYDYLNGGYNLMTTPYSGFRSLWKKINGDLSWNANPWVWVIEFKQI